MLGRDSGQRGKLGHEIVKRSRAGRFALGARNGQYRVGRELGRCDGLTVTIEIRARAEYPANLDENARAQPGSVGGEPPPARDVDPIRSDVLPFPSRILATD